MLSKRFVLRGKVQGVGCRAQVQEIVLSVGHLAGWVRNLESGDVEVCLKGPPLRMESAEKMMRNQMLSPIEVHEVLVEDLGEDFTVAGFQIKR